MLAVEAVGLLICLPCPRPLFLSPVQVPEVSVGITFAFIADMLCADKDLQDKVNAKTLCYKGLEVLFLQKCCDARISKLALC